MATRRPAPGRTRTNDPEGLRGKILDAAAAAFQLRGYHSTTTHDLVREAGVTGGALHHHFRTKKELGLAVIRERVKAAVERTWMEPIESAATAADGVAHAFHRIAADLDERRSVQGCPLNNLATELSLADTDFRAAIRQIYQDWQETIARKLRSDRAAGALGEDLDPEALATFVVASYSGAIALAKAQQHSGPLKLCGQQLVTTLRPKRPRERSRRQKRR
jgi:AcrR family transcriptional regulator